MHSSLGRRLLPVTGLLTLALVLGGLGLPSTASADDPADDSAGEPTVVEPVAESTDAAADALAEVQEILESDSPSRDLTLALRDLRVHQADLSATDRTAARQVAPAKRPPSDMSADFGPVRVHWRSGETTTKWANLVGTTSQRVLEKYAAAGYRLPKSDGTVGGGNGLLDIYVLNLDLGLYGYCDVVGSAPSRGPYDVAAYCAFDNDYAGFPGSPEDTLRVTAAHELFHAVQFAYDYEEDRWFLEATATWVEDELFDDVNDNRQYLAASPLRQPWQSLDQFSSSGLRQYGEWIFFRYLSERWPRSQGGLPVIMRRLMERVDAAKGGPDNYSIQAVRRELASKRTNLRDVFAAFADANRRPRATYEEGRSYRAAPTSGKWTLSARRPDTKPRTTRLNHLASTTSRLTPGAGVGAGWRVRIRVALPARNAAAVVSSYRKNGTVKTKSVRLDKKGRGRAVVKFDRRSVRHVEVTLVNASTRYRCWAGPQGRYEDVFYSCRGKPLDQRQPMRFRARAIR